LTLCVGGSTWQYPTPAFGRHDWIMFRAKMLCV
jgi:hypothetical protein